MNNRVLHIDGFTLEEELQWLSETAGQLPPGSLIVEIGAWLGRSTGALWTGAGRDKIVVAVDTWLGQPSMRDDEQKIVKTEDIFLRFLANMAYLGTVPRWYLPEASSPGLFYLRMESIEAARMFEDESIDMIFLDPDHERCEADCEAWMPKVRYHGIASGHDYSEAFPGVRQAVDLRFPNIRRIGSIWIAAKI